MLNKLLELLDWFVYDYGYEIKQQRKYKRRLCYFAVILTFILYYLLKLEV